MILFSDWLIGEILASYWSIGKGDTPNKPHIYNNNYLHQLMANFHNQGEFGNLQPKSYPKLAMIFKMD